VPEKAAIILLLDGNSLIDKGELSLLLPYFLSSPLRVVNNWLQLNKTDALSLLRLDAATNYRTYQLGTSGSLTWRTTILLGFY